MSNTMEKSPERVEQFKTEIAGMNLRDPSTTRDRQLLRLPRLPVACSIM